tara:strand:+ start:5387 stop:5881 length:495 start_codon:yes stop_codon:yes gene_type:complete
MKIYALKHLQRDELNIDVRLFDSINKARKEYNILLQPFKKDNQYFEVIEEGNDLALIESFSDALGFTNVIEIETFTLNGFIGKYLDSVIYANHLFDEEDNLYLFNDEKKASKKFLDLLYEHRIYGYNVENTTIKYNYEQCIEYFDFNDYDDWGYCKTELIKIES